MLFRRIFGVTLSLTLILQIDAKFCSLYPSYDIDPGIDLSAVWVKDITNCCVVCANHNLCRGFTFEQAQPIVNCFLKRGTYLVPTEKNTVAGIITGSEFYIDVYTEANYGGTRSRILLSNHVQCVQVPPTGIFKSVNTQGACVRMYEHRNCTGRSANIVSPEGPSKNLEHIGFNAFQGGSIGLCMPDEVGEETGM